MLQHRFAGLGALWAIAAGIACGLLNLPTALGEIRNMTDGGAVHFVLQDNLDHPFYWWPNTLLSYPVRFNAPGVQRDNLALTNATNGQTVPMQLSGVKETEGRVTFARVNFFSDLPSNGHREFILQAGKSAPPATQSSNISSLLDGREIEIDTGVLKVRLPASQTPTNEVPGPILQLCRSGGAWIGHSVLVSPNRRVTKIDTVEQEAGPLFLEYRITYTFDGGGTYAATVRCVAGQDFVNLRDEINGLSASDGVYVDQRWNDFHPTNRQAPNHPMGPDEAKVDRAGAPHFAWETIDQELVGTQHGVNAGMTSDGELPFRLGPYQPWGAYVSLNDANFWDEKSGDAIGLFIDDASQWQDNEYAIWMSSDTLQVRYFYQHGLLSWHWPLITGSRSVSIADYDHRKDVQAVADSVAISQGISDGDRTYKTRPAPSSYVRFLSIRYGLLNLNRIKDWVLEYPESARRQRLLFDAPIPPATEPSTSPSSSTEASNPEPLREGKEAAQSVFQKIDRKPAALIRTLWTWELVNDLPVFGVRQSGGFNPVATREMRTYVVAYNRSYEKMTPEQRKKIEAMFLFIAYMDAGEEVMPMRTMLAGHPNFLADIKSVPPMMAMLFPDHPMAREWTDEFEKFVDLNARYHTRPPVAAWDAKGGRWTENLGTYVWAAMRPTISSVWALKDAFDGRNRYCNEQVVQMAGWLVNALTSPISANDLPSFLNVNGKRPPHSWGMLSTADGLRRVYLPQGAHSERRMPPKMLWLLGTLLQQYAPITAEHLMWAAHPNDDDMEFFKSKYDPWSVMFPAKDNRGTNPHLKSSKYTGYGIVMRAAVDTPQEVSVHLQQIDSGPNYRWGTPSEGGCGVIYYYAAGKAYSHNGTEDAGDRAVGDTDLCCNFGVFKEGTFKGIGRNVLDAPFYDLGISQLAQIMPRKTADAYSWPEYQSRRVMMVGADYCVIYDAVFNSVIPTRFAWFVAPKDDMPTLIFLKDARNANKKTELTTAESKGVWFDGTGDSEVLVSHLRNISATVTKARGPSIVTTDRSVDHVFLDANPIDYLDKKAGIGFSGTAGVVRQQKEGAVEMSLFHGRSITACGVTISVDSENVAVAARFIDPAEISGIFSSPNGGLLTLNLPTAATTNAPTRSALYIDGASIDATTDSGATKVTLPAGRHRWQLTRRAPVPQPPMVIRTENRSGATKVLFDPAAGATTYRIEVSNDNAQTWSKAGATSATSQPSFDIPNLTNGTKVHIRVVAINSDGGEAPSDEYPVYVTDSAPLPPDGLKLIPTAGSAALHWGEVLGVTEYRLYARKRGLEKWDCIYHGLDRNFVDARAGIVAPFAQPGAAANEIYSGPAYSVFEYAVSAVNGNGEGAMCRSIDTDPTSWLNWDPRPGEGFRRLLNYNITPFVPESDSPRYYPP